MLSVVNMFLRWIGAFRVAARESNFTAVFGAGLSLIVIGTITYSLGEGWNVIDGFYFAVCTLTTSSIADPSLTLTHQALKIFTAFYVLTGIGILAEGARQLGFGFVKMRAEQLDAAKTGAQQLAAARQARQNPDDPPATPPAE